MTQVEAGRRPVGSVVVTALAGLVMAIGTFLPYLVFRAGTLPVPDESSLGIETLKGRFYLAVGLGLIATAVALFLAGRDTVRTLASLALLASLAVIVGVVIDVVSLERDGLASLAADEGLRPPGVSAEEVVAALEEAGASLVAGLGLYVELGAGVIGALGGTLGLVARLPARPEPEDDVEPAALHAGPIQTEAGPPPVTRGLDEPAPPTPEPPGTAR